MKPLRLLALFFCLAAPVAGDIGSCGQPIADLDPDLFFAEKHRVDCDKCNACNFDTKLCTQACNGKGRRSFDDGCFPLAHDGDVCLNALRAAGCSEYASYVADAGATAPSECNFCPLLEPGTGGASASASHASSSSASTGSGVGGSL